MHVTAIALLRTETKDIQEAVPHTRHLRGTLVAAPKRARLAIELRSTSRFQVLEQLARTFLDRLDDDTDIDLMMAVLGTDVAVVRCLLDAGANVNYHWATVAERTPLIEVAADADDSPQIMRLLPRSGQQVGKMWKRHADYCRTGPICDLRT